MDNIPEVPVTWLWNGRLPRAKLTILAGEPGAGKSLLAADLVARVTCGAAWPDGEAGVSGPDFRIGNLPTENLAPAGESADAREVA